MSPAGDDQERPPALYPPGDLPKIAVAQVVDIEFEFKYWSGDGIECALDFVESDYWIRHAAVPSEQREDSMGRRGYPAEFRQRVLDLVAAGRRVEDVAWDLGLSDQTIYSCRRQDRIDHGLGAGLTSAERAELLSARRRIHELETELAIHRRAAQKEVRGSRGSPGATRLSRARGLGIWLLRETLTSALAARCQSRVAHRCDPPSTRGLAGHLRNPSRSCRADPWPKHHRWSPGCGALDAARPNSRNLRTAEVSSRGWCCDRRRSGRAPVSP
jgi:transposase-like protein